MKKLDENISVARSWDSFSKLREIKFQNVRQFQERTGIPYHHLPLAKQDPKLVVRMPAMKDRPWPFKTQGEERSPVLSEVIFLLQCDARKVCASVPLLQPAGCRHRKA